MAKMSNHGQTKRFLISEMDRSVKRMLKLIEEEGDSFAKKAEIYIQKRPELISQVENFYRMFRTLAERYDDATSDLRSQNGMNDICSEPPSAMTSPEHRFSTRRLSGTHAVFLDVGNGNRGYETSTYDSGSDPDDSFYNNNYPPTSNYGNYRRLRRKITELEGELKKIQIEQDMNKSNPSEVADYEEELRIAREKISVYEDEICSLKTKLEKYEILHDSYKFFDESSVNNNNRGNNGNGNDDVVEGEPPREEDGYETETEDEVEFGMKVRELEEEVRLKDEQIDEMNERLEKLQVECEESRKRIGELEKMVERQREMIEEGDEEKRETERQLCISLEHYRNAYQMLRKGLLEQKKNPVLAS